MTLADMWLESYDLCQLSIFPFQLRLPFLLHRASALLISIYYECFSCSKGIHLQILYHAARKSHSDHHLRPSRTNPSGILATLLHPQLSSSASTIDISPSSWHRPPQAMVFLRQHHGVPNHQISRPRPRKGALRSHAPC